MSKHEDQIILDYWKEVRGTLCKDFQVVRKGETWGPRTLDAVILPEGRHRKVKKNKLSELIDGRYVVVVQAKAKPLSMYLIGQTLFSDLLIKRYYDPNSVRAVALCKEDDPILHPLLISIGEQVGVDIEVKEYPDAKPSDMSEGPGSDGRRMIDWYWGKVGGTLLWWNPRKNVNKGLHLPHAVIVQGGLKDRKEVLGEDILKGQDDVVVLHARAGVKKDRLGMYLMGQALFGAELVRQKFRPRSIRSVALCGKDDSILHPMLRDVGNKIGIKMEVVVAPKKVYAQPEK